MNGQPNQNEQAQPNGQAFIPVFFNLVNIPAVVPDISGALANIVADMALPAMRYVDLQKPIVFDEEAVDARLEQYKEESDEHLKFLITPIDLSAMQTKINSDIKAFYADHLPKDDIFKPKFFDEILKKLDECTYSKYSSAGPFSAAAGAGAIFKKGEYTGIYYADENGKLHNSPEPCSAAKPD
ncbi:MAG: hypothetical protein Q7V63_08705 [Gammaproteobacteria bacterium]|nr:hypothetical protein [Gammaproteobacteria bacterium]